MIIHCPPDYEVVPCFKLQSSIFLKKINFCPAFKKIDWRKSSWWIRTKRVCKGSHHSYLPWKGLGCFWHLGCCHLPSVKWISGDKKVKKPRRRPPPVSAAARGALAAACERLYSVGSRCLEAWTGSRVKSSQCNCSAMQPDQTRSDNNCCYVCFSLHNAMVTCFTTDLIGVSSMFKHMVIPRGIYLIVTTPCLVHSVYITLQRTDEKPCNPIWLKCQSLPFSQMFAPSRYSVASLLLSLLLISSLANAAPKSRSSKLKVGPC